MKRKITYGNFVKWVNTLNDRRRFRFLSNEDCAFALFLKSLGAKDILVGGITYDLNGKSTEIPRDIYQVLSDPRINSVETFSVKTLKKVINENKQNR